MADNAVRVGIVMGSDSDLPVVAEAARVLDSLQVGCEMRVISAHRTPEEAAAYAREAESRGLGVILAAAGGAAHLPGVLAAYTVLPVVGLPLRGWALDGLDALYAIVQMPPGIPVATVGINGARNAALLAAEILAVGDPALRARLREERQRMAESVRQRDQRLQRLGAAAYLEERSAAGKGGGGAS